jgi:hypothetical protein
MSQEQNIQWADSWADIERKSKYHKDVAWMDFPSRHKIVYLGKNIVEGRRKRGADEVA